MAYTYKELKKMNLADLKEIAKGIEHEAVKGYTQMNKEHLLGAICAAVSINMHEHHDVVGINKAQVKVQIRRFKKMRDKAFKEKDTETANKARKRIKRLKRTIHRATV